MAIAEQPTQQEAQAERGHSEDHDLDQPLRLCCLAATAANAQSDYPNKPVRIVVNVAAGGGVDTATRIVAQRLSEKLGQTFVIENRPGAGGNVGAEAVYHAPADGYTLMASSGSPLAINGYLYKKMNYEMEGFEVISVFSQIPNVLVVRPNFPAKDGKEFLAYVKANPTKLNYASQGAGTAAHLTGEMFNVAMGVKMTHVPYKGTAPALNDLIAGHVDATFIQVSASLSAAQGRQGAHSARRHGKAHRRYP